MPVIDRVVPSSVSTSMIWNGAPPPAGSQLFWLAESVGVTTDPSFGPNVGMATGTLVSAGMSTPPAVRVHCRGGAGATASVMAL
jgi:hypothetical protein